MKNRDRGDDTQDDREEMIRVDGRGQVLEMLRAADPEFREVLLRGIEKRDAKLARELRKAL
ncbi:MAG: hypothetical protein AB1540_11690 [Bdellovibrionota bacterium]